MSGAVMTQAPSVCWCGSREAADTGVSRSCVRCPSCATIRSRVFPYQEVVESDEYRNPDTGGFDASYSEWMSYGALSVALIESQLKEPWTGRRFLDIGASGGHTLAVAAARGFEPFGVDVDPYRIRYAQERFGLRNVHCGTFESVVPKLPADFAAVNLAHVLEHLPRPVEFLRLVATVMAKDGVLLVSLPNVDSLQRRLKGDAWAGWQFRQHLWHFSAPTLAPLLAAAEFDVLMQQDQPLGAGAERYLGRWRVTSSAKAEPSRRGRVVRRALDVARRLRLGRADQLFVAAQPRGERRP